MSLATGWSLAACGAVGTPPSILPQWHHAAAGGDTNAPPTCRVRVGAARDDVLEDCGAPACRPRPDEWVYPSARVAPTVATRYVIVSLHAEVVGQIEACGKADCCRP